MEIENEVGNNKSGSDDASTRFLHEVHSQPTVSTKSLMASGNDTATGMQFLQFTEHQDQVLYGQPQPAGEGAPHHSGDSGSAAAPRVQPYQQRTNIS